MFSTSLFFTVLKSSLAKMLAKKGVVDNQTNGYIMRTSLYELYRVAKGEAELVASVSQESVHFLGQVRH